MRYLHFFIDLGDGWQNLTPHDGAAAALSDVSLTWGTDDPTVQPDPSVLTFHIVDRTGQLAGKVLNLSMARVRVQLTSTPTWNEFAPRKNTTWNNVDPSLTWNHFASLHEPDHTSPPDDSLIDVFTGRISTGGTVSKRDDSWLLTLSATSDFVQLKRSTTKGPHHGKWGLDFHWDGLLIDRWGDAKDRAKSLGIYIDPVWRFGWQYPTGLNLTPIASDSFPDLLTILNTVTNGGDGMWQWFEYHQPGQNEIRAFQLGGTASIIMAADGTVSARLANREDDEGMSMKALPASQIISTDAELEIPDPITTITLKGSRQEQDEDGAYSFSDIEKVLDLRGPDSTLPEKTLSLESSFILQVKTGDTITDELTKISPHLTQSLTKWATQIASRLIPTGLSVDTLHTDPDEFENVFLPQPFGPLVFLNNQFTTLSIEKGKGLADANGVPATQGAWMAIGGTLTYRFVNNLPVITHEFNLTPLVTDREHVNESPVWNDVTISLPYTSLDPQLTWNDLGQIDQFTTK